jgi:hypothetical protein
MPPDRVKGCRDKGCRPLAMEVSTSAPRIFSLDRVLLAGTMLVAVACRIPAAGDRLTGDEGYSWIVGSAPTAAAFLDRLARYENTPPLFYLLLTPVRLDDEVWVRWPSIAAGVAAVPVLYAAVRALLGTRAGLLAALGLAVSPLASAFSDYARGFTLSTLGLVIASWACARLGTGGRRRWWWAYAGGAALAVWSEYNAVLFLVCMLGAMLILRARPWWETVVLGLAPMATLAPWLHQLQRGLDYDKVTKIAPLFPAPSPGVVRDVGVALCFGRHGVDAAAPVRSLLFAVIVVLLAWATIMLRRRPQGRTAVWLLAGTLVGALLLHAALRLVDIGIFEQRYLTGLIPLCAALLAGGIDSLRWRAAVPVAAVVLVAAGAGIVILRHGREMEPDYGRAQQAARGVRTVLTNSAVVAYYLHDPKPVLDRPVNLGAGSEGSTRRPYAVVDDNSFGGARRGPGRVVARVADRIVVRVVR